VKFLIEEDDIPDCFQKESGMSPFSGAVRPLEA
jgi:hypothetical protein